MSKDAKVAEVKVEAKAAEVKAEKAPTEKQLMLKAYKEMSAQHKSWRQKFNANFPVLHSAGLTYLKAVQAQLSKWDAELDKILADAAKAKATPAKA